jgi:protein-tyrosine phosphatase
MMVDIHSHILPGVDDGAKSVEIALDMVRMAHADGIRHMVATPHASDRYTYDRPRSLELLNQLRRECGVAMEFSLGCDFHFSFDNIQSALHDPHHYCISKTDFLLVEFSDFAISPNTADTLHTFVEMGITPVLTHPERNAILQKKQELVLTLVELGCIVQVTANSMTGFWGERPRKAAEWLLDRDCVHVIASDAHDLQRRPPIMSSARALLTQRYGAELATALCEQNPRAVVENQHLPYLPEPRRQK